MTRFFRALALLLCAALLLTALPAFAQEATDTPMTQEEAEASGIEVEGMADDEDAIEADADDEVASIAGLTPLYTTRIKPFTADGGGIRMRAKQSSESDIVCILKKNDVITIYKVYPSYVLCEHEGNVGFIIRTWINENCTTIDPSTTPPYGVVPSTSPRSRTRRLCMRCPAPVRMPTISR